MPIAVETRLAYSDCQKLPGGSSQKRWRHDRNNQQ
jgi:hypothetical protein